MSRVGVNTFACELRFLAATLTSTVWRSLNDIFWHHFVCLPDEEHSREQVEQRSRAQIIVTLIIENIGTIFHHLHAQHSSQPIIQISVFTQPLITISQHCYKYQLFRKTSHLHHISPWYLQVSPWSQTWSHPWNHPLEPPKKSTLRVSYEVLCGIPPMKSPQGVPHKVCHWVSHEVPHEVFYLEVSPEVYLGAPH